MIFSICSRYLKYTFLKLRIVKNLVLTSQSKIINIRGNYYVLISINCWFKIEYFESQFRNKINIAWTGIFTPSSFSNSFTILIVKNMKDVHFFTIFFNYSNHLFMSPILGYKKSSLINILNPGSTFQNLSKYCWSFINR